jgi:hypothetical protein
MQRKQAKWTLESSEASIVVTHNESGHSFTFMRVSEAPYVSGSPLIRIADRSSISPDQLLDEAIQIAIDQALDESD